MIVSTLQPNWKYQAGDWVVEPGFPNHHLRIIDSLIDDNHIRWYLIFDTTMRDGFSDFRWRHADALESTSKLEARPRPEDVPAIIERAIQVRYLLYSILSRTDCETLQRWIHTGMEQVRWSPQVWTGIAATVIGSLFIAASQQPAPRRQRRRRRA